MTHIATQQINSGFGTYHPGDHIDEDVPPSVRETWLAAGLVENTAAPAPEKSTAPSRVTTKATPHKRFVENTAAPAPEKSTTGPQG